MEQLEKYLNEKIQAQTHKAVLNDLARQAANSNNPKKQLIFLGLMCVVAGVHALNDRKTTELTREMLKSYSKLL